MDRDGKRGLAERKRPAADQRAEARWLIFLPIAFTVAVFGSALAAIVWKSVLPFTLPGQTGSSLTIENYRTLFADTYYLGVLWRTITLALVVVLGTTVISVPISYCLARSSSRWTDVGIGIVLASVTMSLVIRALGWIGILDFHGPVNFLLAALGMTPFRFLGSSSGVVIGLVHGFVPLMTLSLLPIMQNIDPILEDAAHGLGAGAFAAFWRIVLPLALPGIFGSALMIFAICMGSFTTPAILGGGRFVVFAELIQEQIVVALNFPLAAALAALLMAIVLLLMAAGATAAARRHRIISGA
jgi:putative spermidine/putrescine transport system permease protein